MYFISPSRIIALHMVIIIIYNVALSPVFLFTYEGICPSRTIVFFAIDFEFDT